MRNRTLVALGAATAALSSIGSPVIAEAHVQRVPLHRFVDKTCDGEDAGERPTSGANGSVSLRVTRRGEVVAKVTLEGAGPNRRYHVRLITQGDADCTTYDGELVTNAKGRGTTTVTEAKAPVVFVFVSWPNLGHEPDGSGDYYSTPTVLLP